MKNAEMSAMKMAVQISLSDSVFVSFRYISRSGTAGSYGTLHLIFLGTPITSGVPIYICKLAVLQWLCLYTFPATGSLSSHPF